MVGESVGVVPAVLVGIAMRARSLEFDECDLAGVIELTDTDGAGFGEQVHGRFGPVGERDRPVFDERGLLDAFAALVNRSQLRGLPLAYAFRRELAV